MFQFLEPPPLDYYLEDVTPNFLSDGVLLNFKPGPTHKYIAKQLLPIPAKSSDPIKPSTEVDPRVLDKWVKQNEAWIVDSRALHAMVSLLPKEDPNLRRGQKKSTSIFPKSKRYEYEYIQNERIKKFFNKKIPKEINCNEIEKERFENEAFSCSRRPFWWKENNPELVSDVVVSMNDYSVEHFNPPGTRDMLIRKRLQLEDSKAYVPGSLYQKEHPEYNNMQEVLDRADAYKIEIKEDFKQVSKVCECPVYASTKIVCPGNESVKSVKQDLFENQKWHPDFMVTDRPKDEKERRVEMSKVSRPYLHELNIWYSKNMPTQSAQFLKKSH